MVPIREYSNWNKRKVESLEIIEPKKKYYIFVEGQKTEAYYMKGFVNNYASNIEELIEIKYEEKTGNDKGISNPKDLVEYAKKELVNTTYDKDTDKVIIVFDADIYKGKDREYQDILKLIRDNGFIPAVSYPSFELFLLLHKDNSYEEIIKSNIAEILENKNVSKDKKFLYKLCNDTYGFDVKSKGKVKEIAGNFDIALIQENMVNENIDNCIGCLSCNVAYVLNMALKGKL